MTFLLEIKTFMSRLLKAFKMSEKQKKCSEYKAKVSIHISMLQCFEWPECIHYKNKNLPRYTSACLENLKRKFSCKNCVNISTTFSNKKKQEQYRPETLTTVETHTENNCSDQKRLTNYKKL